MKRVTIEFEDEDCEEIMKKYGTMDNFIRTAVNNELSTIKIDVPKAEEKKEEKKK
jgi:hypothetical protein